MKKEQQKKCTDKKDKQQKPTTRTAGENAGEALPPIEPLMIPDRPVPNRARTEM